MGHKLMFLKVLIRLPRRTRLLCGDVVYVKHRSQVLNESRAVWYLYSACGGDLPSPANDIRIAHNREREQPTSELRA